MSTTKEILDELGDPILDETGNAFYDESATDSDGVGYIIPASRMHFIVPGEPMHYEIPRPS